MARPIRYEAPGAIYHIIARGDGGKRVFDRESDRSAWLERKAEACGKFGWRVHAWVLMGNHVHWIRPKRKTGSLAGSAARAHDEAEAEQIVSRCLAELDLPAESDLLAGRGRWLDEKALIATIVKTHTAASNAWVAERLAMGHPSSVSRAVRRVRESPRLQRSQRRLVRMLDFKD